MPTPLLLPLEEATLATSPWPLFQRWLDDAIELALPDPNAMTLATATPQGVPSARMVLLRGHDERGFAFYTNYQSRKACELDSNPHAALVLFWATLQRQIRIEGSVTRVTAAESDTYFQSRPRGHRLGAWSSPQSQVIPDRLFLEAQLADVMQQYPEGDVPRPDHWGGYRVAPRSIEFWQGGENRLHDRIVYRQVSPGVWTIERLAP